MESKDRRLTALFFALWAFFLAAFTVFCKGYLYDVLTPPQRLAAALAFCAAVALPLQILSNHFARKAPWKAFSILTLILIIHHTLALVVGTSVFLIRHVL